MNSVEVCKLLYITGMPRYSYVTYCSNVLHLFWCEALALRVTPTLYHIPHVLFVSA